MNITKKLKNALDSQIEQESHASQFYLSAGIWANVNGFDGASQYFYRQSDEERGHMLKIVHLLDDIGVPAISTGGQ